MSGLRSTGLTLFLAVVLFIPAASALEDVSPVSAVLQGLEGEVEAFRHGATEWVEAAQGTEYAGRDQLSTGEKSWALLQFHGNHLLKMQAETEMSVERLWKRSDTGDEVTEIKLSKGEILNRVRKLPTRGSIYSIRTPTATSSVRGTRFSVRVYEKDGKWLTDIRVLDGVVEVTNRVGMQLTITDAEEAEISEISMPSEPAAMGADAQEGLAGDMATLEQTGTGGEGDPSGLQKDSKQLQQQINQLIEGLETDIEEPSESDLEDRDDSNMF